MMELAKPGGFFFQRTPVWDNAVRNRLHRALSAMSGSPCGIRCRELFTCWEREKELRVQAQACFAGLALGKGSERTEGRYGVPMCRRSMRWRRRRGREFD